MKRILIGNSLVRGLRLNPDTFSKVIAIPGACVEDMMRFIETRPDIVRCQVYIMEGAIRYTKKIVGPTRKEVVLREGRSRLGPLADVLRASRVWLKEQRQVEVIYCQIPAMSIKRLNDFLHARHGGRRLMRAFEQDWQSDLQRLIRDANRVIVADNNAAGVCTPWTTKGTITSNRAFRFHRLVDGLHPTAALVVIWKRELERVATLNALPFRR